MFEANELNERGQAEVNAFKSEYSKLTEFALGRMPKTKSTAMFLSKVEEAVMWGTRALSEHKDNQNKIQVPKKPELEVVK